MEENKDGLIEFFRFMAFGSMFGLVDTEKCRNALLKAVKDKDYEGLSEVMGATIDTSRKAVEAINEIIAKQVEEHGVSVEEMIDALFVGNGNAMTPC